MLRAIQRSPEMTCPVTANQTALFPGGIIKAGIIELLNTLSATLPQTIRETPVLP